MSGRFRPDIEGLRAIAILPILAFHLDPKLSPGGFVGVDIFFVISGALITKMILEQEGKFSFRSFYLRRAMRLMPALLVTLLATLAAGWKYNGPSEFMQLARSALTAALGVSNFYFFATFDYFQPAGITQPLLHTWSLGLEEQVYLFWPLLLVMARHRASVVWLVVISFVASFALALSVQGASPQASFYIMPFRLFEFSVGAAVVLAAPVVQNLSIAVRNVLGALAALLLGVSFALFDKTTVWPSILTILPALGTALLLAAGPSSIWGCILSLTPLRFLGRISYSVYLVHWPIIVFYRAHAITDASALENAILFVASILIGFALFVLVENPFRQSGAHEVLLPRWARPLALTQRTRVVCIAWLFATLVLSASATLVMNGFPSRLDHARIQLIDRGLSFAGDVCDQRYARCTFGDKTADRVVYLIGDSHALNLVHGLDALFQELNVRGVAMYDHGCLFAYGTKRFINGKPDQKCMQNIQRTFDFLVSTREPVIIAGDYAGYRSEIGPADSSTPIRLDEAEYFRWIGQRLTQGIDLLKPAERPVVVLKQAYSSGVDLPRCLAQPEITPLNREARCPTPNLEGIQRIYRGADAMIDDISAKRPSVIVVDPKSHFCDAKRCILFTDEGRLHFRDQTHLTNEGSLFLVTSMRTAIQAALGTVQH